MSFDGPAASPLSDPSRSTPKPTSVTRRRIVFCPCPLRLSAPAKGLRRLKHRRNSLRNVTQSIRPKKTLGGLELIFLGGARNPTSIPPEVLVKHPVAVVKADYGIKYLVAAVATQGLVRLDGGRPSGTNPAEPAR